MWAHHCHYISIYHSQIIIHYYEGCVSFDLKILLSENISRKKNIFKCLVAFLKLPRKIFQVFDYILENVMEIYFLLFSHISSIYIIKKKIRLKKL